jgi:hypothetical protein
MAQPPVVLGGFKGVRNTVTAERLGGEDLERARNVDLDDAGQIRRRRGYAQVIAGNFHSLFTHADGTVFVVRDGSLCIARPNFTTETLLGGVGTQPLAYVEIGDNTFFSSRTVAGVIGADNIVLPWGTRTVPGTWVSPVTEPTSTLGEIAGKLVGPPPLAHALAHLNGRIYLAAGRTVWATELYLYHYVDKTRGYMQFDADVTVLGAVSDGIYVGTTNALWFLTGSYGEMRRSKVYPHGVLPGSLVKAPPDTTLPEQPAARVALMLMTDHGLCACQDGGLVVNITQDRMVFPAATTAAAMFRQQDGINQYVGVLDSAGTPTSTARVGDYVDAEIRRFQGASP